MIYKRDGKNKWEGPGIVIGQNRQIVFIQHGGEWYKVPNCRIQRAGHEVFDEVNPDRESLLGDVECAEGESAEVVVGETTEPVAGVESAASTAGGESAGQSHTSIAARDVTEVMSNDLIQVDNVGVDNVHDLVSNAEMQSGEVAGNISIGSANASESSKLPEPGKFINFRMQDEDVWRQA